LSSGKPALWLSSLRMASTVKLLVIDAMRNTVEAVTGVLDLMFCRPVAATWARLSSITTPQTMPGIFFSSA